MLTQLATATAQNGTNRPTIGGAFLTMLFNVSALPNAPPVAMKYDFASCLKIELIVKDTI